MLHVRTLLLLVAALCLPVSAGAVTVADIIELTRAGLSDDILVAVIDADRTVFSLDKDTILELKGAGVSRAVLLKMIKSRREFDATAQDPASQPPQGPQQQVVVIGATPPPPAPEPTPVVVPMYYYVPLSIWGTPARHAPRAAPQPFLAAPYRGFGRFINDGWVERP